MNITRCDLEGLLIIEPKVFGDNRGFFMETWNQRRYSEAGIGAAFVQDNISVSRFGALRGLHCQNPSPQSKLVSVLQGAVFDVAVDIRQSSPTFGKWHGLELSAENKRQFFIPAGFAHGFLVLSESYFPGWRARIDGSSVPVERTDLDLQGARIPPGRHSCR